MRPDSSASWLGEPSRPLAVVAVSGFGYDRFRCAFSGEVSEMLALSSAAFILAGTARAESNARRWDRALANIGRVIFGIKIDDDRLLAAKVGEPQARLPEGLLELELRCLLTRPDCHRRSPLRFRREHSRSAR